MDTFVGSFTFMHERLSLMLEKTGQHVWMCAIVIAVSLVVAVPVGLWLGHLHRGEFVTTSISNVGRALPNLAVIAIGLGIFGLNFVNIAVALLITAIPPILSQAYLAVDQVDPDMVRAARGMGLTPSRSCSRSSCRWPSRCSSPGSGSRWCTSSPPRPWPPWPEAADWGTSFSARPTTGWKG